MQLQHKNSSDGIDPQTPLKAKEKRVTFAENDDTKTEERSIPSLTVELQQIIHKMNHNNNDMDETSPTPYVTPLTHNNNDTMHSMVYDIQPTFRHAPTIRANALELPPRHLQPEKIEYEIAITYLRDALKIRPPQRRIRQLLGENTRFKPLTAYRIMKSWLWSRFIYFLIWFNMLLAVWEPPQEHLAVAQYWTLQRVRIIIIFQIIFIVFYSFDIYLKFYSHDKREIGQWTYIISFCLLYTFLISILTYFFYDIHACQLLYRSSRVIRPFFLFYKSRDLKKLARSILRGIPSLFEVGALIILFLLLFSFTAYYLFYEGAQFTKLGQDNPNFKSFSESVFSLVILQTTANFPDVMMPSYHESEWTALFFFIYNVLGIYFLMALVLAVIYNNYSDHILRDVERIKNVRERAIKEAFKVLTYHQNSNKGKNVKKKLPKKRSKDKYKKVVYLSTFTQIMKKMRKDLYSTFGNNESGVEEQIKWMYLAMANVLSYGNELTDEEKRDYDNGLDKKQFLQIAAFIELEITKDIAKAKRISVLKKTKQFQTQRNLLIIGQEDNKKENILNRSSYNLMTKVNSIPIYWYQFRLKLISFWQWRKEFVCCKKETNDKFRGHAHRMSMTIDSIFRHDINSSPSSPRSSVYKKHSTWSEDVITQCSSFEISTEYFINLLVMFSTVFVILDIYHLSSRIQWCADIILYAFLFEVIFKMIAFGVRGYLADNFNKLDFILSIVAFLFEELLQNTIKIIIIFRIIRLLRLLRAFTRFRVILRTSKAVLSSFRSLFILEFCIAYIYAIVGMELFDNVINQTVVRELCQNTASNDPLQVPFWCSIYSTYYYDNNFNSFTRAMVVQMELIVVNNWHIITEMFVLQTSIYARFYFLGVYFSAVVVVMNVLTAFVLEAFISQYENNENENRRSNDENENETDNEDANTKKNNSNTSAADDKLENEIETRMHAVIKLFRAENEVKIFHYTRKLSKALFYEQLYPQLFQQNEDEKLNLTQRSDINSIYSNYTQRLSGNNINIKKNYKHSDYDPIRKLGIFKPKTNVIEEENDDHFAEVLDINNSQQQLITPMQDISGLEVIKSDNSMDFAHFAKAADHNSNNTTITLHNTENSNTFVVNKRESISMDNVDNDTPTFAAVGHSNDETQTENDTKHKMDFSIDSLSNITAINQTDSIIPTLHTPSTSNVHANYFDIAPTASALITANKNKYHFITMPSHVNKKTSVKSGTKLVSSQVSKLNNVKIQRQHK